MRAKPAAKPKTKSYLPRFGVSCTAEDLKIMDQRAESLGLDRSSYLVQLARQDFLRKSDFVMVPKEKLVLPP